MRNDISWTVVRNFAGQPCSDPVLGLVQSRARAGGAQAREAELWGRAQRVHRDREMEGKNFV